MYTLGINYLISHIAPQSVTTWFGEAGHGAGTWAQREWLKLKLTPYCIGAATATSSP